ncbi:SDR family NAD(P)-dependent oxidoreductase [Phaeocystidibacter luteus]|uniref:SDR family NAD(P)-dependent oxidoreductase n=1 Tax=Phaeocystidibacter luteus TaxID=911197 RepID=A0A6N6RF58_9FLAO|nr:SDR family NAD(P)-dependent oxidoreductase [Phaeocystidibacter luteus]KAB2809790.1 SDR family NAD(P)-dependent oxidoreductase [Phaeocystidibacter luteus]
MQNQVVWITGASSGIGEAMAKHLNSLGHRVVLSARRKEELDRVASECQFPDNAAVVVLDQEDHSSIENSGKAAIAAFGHIDTLIANSGIGQFGSVTENEWAVEKKLIDINLLGTMAVVRSVLPHMTERKSGRIIGIASIAGKFGQRNLAAYSASKAGVILWLESLREEVYTNGITVQSVSPGFIQTQVTVNSLRPDGTKINKNSKAQEAGMPTSTFAKKMMKVMGSSKFHHYIGRKELLAIPIHTFARGLLYKLLRRSYR